MAHMFKLFMRVKRLATTLLGMQLLVLLLLLPPTILLLVHLL